MPYHTILKISKEECVVLEPPISVTGHGGKSEVGSISSHNSLGFSLELRFSCMPASSGYFALSMQALPVAHFLFLMQITAQFLGSLQNSYFMWSLRFIYTR